MKKLVYIIAIACTLMFSCSKHKSNDEIMLLHLDSLQINCGTPLDSVKNKFKVFHTDSYNDWEKYRVQAQLMLTDFDTAAMGNTISLCTPKNSNKIVSASVIMRVNANEADSSDFIKFETITSLLCAKLNLHCGKCEAEPFGNGKKLLWHSNGMKYFMCYFRTDDENTLVMTYEAGEDK